ncbi:MAG: hypothetical protein WD294_02370 [Phycisphaeraceae bacterium]
MTWIDMPATNHTDWSSADFLNQFVDAINWRIRVASGFELSSVSVGADVQRRNLIRSWQSRIEQLATSFTDPSKPDFSQLDIDPATWFWTLPDWRNAAGLHPDGFTRKYPDAAGNIINAYGLLEVGDYIGPWLFNELKQALEPLTHRSYFWSPGFSPHGQLDLYDGEYSVDDDYRQLGFARGWGSSMPWSSVIAAAECDFSGGSNCAPGDDLELVGPGAGGFHKDVENGRIMQQLTTFGQTRKYAWIQRTRRRIGLQGVHQNAVAQIPAHANVYLAAGDTGVTGDLTFNAHGEPVLENQWTNYWQGNMTVQDGQLVTGLMGSLDMLNAVPESHWPTSHGESTKHGWNIHAFEHPDLSFNPRALCAVVAWEF